MTPACKRALLDGLRADLVAYRELQKMLDDQFQAALRLDVDALRALAAAIDTEVASLEARRDARVARVGTEPGGAARLAELLFPGGGGRALQRASVIKHCGEIEALIRACKARVARNGNLLAMQSEAMHSLLKGEPHTYAPR
ncbi:flagellar export chaperone FlgN [Burkholderia contaminans]|uniref:flagellar export chaperone FlgN n=1 Tax=Burkholderia contaminans TaxID=488447 RepID=UPI00069D6318|nr:flagellar export chaperone FlgN [Burkholderia contaminans]